MMLSIPALPPGAALGQSLILAGPRTPTRAQPRAGKAGHLRPLSPDCRRLLGTVDSISGGNILAGPLYAVASASVMY